MKDAFAKEQKPLESCQAPSFSFYQLIDDLWHQGGNPNPLHRLCTLMRKMKVKSFIREELELNEELLEEQNMAIQRYNQNVGLTATRLTFFRSLSSPLKWDDPIDFTSPEKCVGHIDGDPPETKTGLNYQELEAVVRQLGGRTVSADFVQNTAVEYDQFIYPFVESACPVILGIEGWNFNRSSIISHVVSVLGHTLNSDRWEPEARSGYGGFPAESYTPVTAWVGHYIINDDNFGMYVTLPSDMLRNYLVPSKNPNLHATRAIAIVPSGVRLSGLLAEGMAVSFVQSLAKSEWMDQFVIFLKQTGLPIIWLKRLAQQSDKIVSRTLLQTKSSYRQYIDGLVQRGQVTLTPEIGQRFENMPEHIWVSEITLPHLYTGNKHKLGDVIIDANATDEEHSAVESFELAWFPGFIYFGSDHQILPWDVRTHVPLIREEETIPLLEW